MIKNQITTKVTYLNNGIENLILDCERLNIINETFTRDMFFEIYYKDPAFHSLIDHYRFLNLTHNEKALFFSCFSILCLKCMYEYFPETHPKNRLNNIKFDISVKIPK